MKKKDPSIDQTVGNHVIIERLGTSPSGDLFVAEHPDIHNRVVVKVLRPEHVVRPGRIARMLAEARATNSIAHPGVVRVLDYGVDGSIGAYLIMEHVEGATLARRLEQDGPLPAHEAVRLVRQTAEVLARVHESGVVHRNLKPSNIFVVPDPAMPGGERVRVAGFALAKFLEEEDARGVTRTGEALGSPQYLSPEQCLDTKRVDATTDIYALGVITFQLLCGKLPFEGKNISQMVVQHASGAPPSLLNLAPSMPLALDAAIQRALAKVRQQRWQTMAQLVEALDRAVPGTGRAMVPGVPVVAPSTPVEAPGDGPVRQPVAGPPAGASPPVAASPPVVASLPLMQILPPGSRAAPVSVPPPGPPAVWADRRTSVLPQQAPAEEMAPETGADMRQTSVLAEPVQPQVDRSPPEAGNMEQTLILAEGFEEPKDRDQHGGAEDMLQTLVDSGAPAAVDEHREGAGVDRDDSDR